MARLFLVIAAVAIFKLFFGQYATPMKNPRQTDLKLEEIMLFGLLHGPISVSLMKVVGA
jgi:hypothetical protein